MNRLKRKEIDRPRAFWGALISAGIGVANSLINSSAQEKQRRLQASLENYNNDLKEAQGMTNALNAGQDYQQNYLQQFKQQARLGTTRRLGSRNIMITDGGNAKRIGNNTYLLRGGSHEDINETGQTGIGINVGGNEIEAEGGEVAQRKGNSLRIYSAQPILGGMSPAQAIIRGYNKDKVFNAQQRFKKNNGIKDDGSKAQIGGEVPYNHYDPTGLFGGSPHPLAKIIDITGITSYGDVKKLINKKRRGEIPTTQEYLGALSAIPAIGRIAKGLNIIGNIADSTSFMKDAKESEAKENTYQNEIVKYRDIHGKIKTGRRGSMPYTAHELRKRLGGLTSKDRGSSKHPYPSVSSKDFAGGGRSYPIPTKADAVDALRLAGLHGRSDVKSKVYSKYPELRKKAKFGDWFTSLFNNNTATAPKKTVHFYKSKSGRVFKNYNEALYDNKLWNNDVVYRYNIKGDLYHKKYGLREHNIPFQKQNAITLRNAGRASGAVISPNQLDSIAKYANRAGLSIPTAFGMVMKESTFNNPTDTKSAAKLFGLKKGTREYNKWITGQHFQGNGSRLDKGNARDFINFNKDDSLNPYWQDMRYVKNQTRDMNKAREMLINGERNADRKAKYAPKLTKGKKLNVMEAAFKDYKTNPYGYNPGQKDYVKLINQNAKDIMNSPQIQQWYKSSPYAKGRKYKCGGRIKADFGTWVRSNRNNNVLANLLYESGIIDKNAWRNMLRDIHTFTGMGSDPYNDNQDEAVVTPGFGIPNQAQILRNVQQANKLMQAAKASQAAQRTSYAVKQAKDFYRDLGINIPIGRSQIYNPAFRSSALARNIENSNKALQISLNNTHLPKGIRLTPIDQSSIGRTAARIINPREAEIVRMSIPISQSAKNMTSGVNPFLYAPRSSNEALKGLSRVISSAKQGAKSVGQRVGNKLTSSSTYRNPTFAERVRDANGKLIWKQNYKYKPWVKATAGAAGTAGVIGLGVGLSNTKSEDKNIKAQLDAKGQPISPYIARPQEPAKSQSKQVNKVVKRQVRTTPQYKGNTTKGNYQLHDGETKVINGIKYTRRGNTIINHKTNVGYIYDKNGNYTGQADYSKVGNFNQAFDAARAAGRSQFIYRAGKYNNYSTVKETNAKKEALNRRIGASRIAKRMGCLTNPPVGSRKKYLPGGTANPWDKYRFTDYSTPNTWNEKYGISNVPDYGGVSPWQISNKYDVNIPYSISKYDLPITTITAKKNTFNDEMSKRMKAGVQNLKDDSDSKTTVPYLGKQSSFKPTTQDYIGLGIDTLASLGIGLINSSAASKTYLPERTAIIQASKLPTYYNVAPQVEEVKRQRDILNGEIANNTSSSVAALNRISRIRGAATGEINKLYATKENEENKMLTQDALNQQQVAAENAKLQADYETNKANILNAASQAKANALSGTLSGLSQAWNNFASSVENRYDTRQNEIAAISSANNPSVVKNAVSLGYNLSPEVLANLYKNSKNEELRNTILGRLSPNERKRYGIK